MSEKLSRSTLPHETTRDSGLIVPGEYAESSATAPKVVIPTQSEKNLYSRSIEQSSVKDEQEKSYEYHRQSYEDIVEPRHVIELKDALEAAQARLGTKSENINKGLSLTEQKKAIKQHYIEEYLQTGSPDKDRPIPDDIRRQLEDLLSLSFDELQEMIGSDDGGILDSPKPDISSKKDTDTIPSFATRAPKNNAIPYGPEYRPNTPPNTGDMPSDSSEDDTIDFGERPKDNDQDKGTTDERNADKYPSIDELSRMIDAADERSDARERVDELNKIIAKCIKWDNEDNSLGYGDMAVVAAFRIKYSQSKNPKRVLNTAKTFLVRPKNIKHNALSYVAAQSDRAFESIALKLRDQEVSIDAANQIDDSDKRDGALQKLAERAFTQSSNLQARSDEATTYDERNKFYFQNIDQWNIAESIIDMIGKRESRDIKKIREHLVHGENLSLDTDDQMARRGLRGFLMRRKQQNALYNIAVSSGNEQVARRIKDSRLSQKAIDEIQRQKHL